MTPKFINKKINIKASMKCAIIWVHAFYGAQEERSLNYQKIMLTCNYTWCFCPFTSFILCSVMCILYTRTKHRLICSLFFSVIQDRIMFYLLYLGLQISLRPARDSMAASQRPGGTGGRSQTPPAQKSLVRKFSWETLFLPLARDSCPCTDNVEDDEFTNWELVTL